MPQSYLPKCERCWRGEFVKMRIWNLQLLLVYSIILWKILPHQGRLNFWLTVWTGISDPELLGFHSLHMVMCVPTHERPRFDSGGRNGEEDAVGFAKKKFRNTMRVPSTWRPFVAARHSGSAFRQDFEKVGLRLVTWECPLRTGSASWKSLESFIQLIAFCNSWIFSVNSRMVFRSLHFLLAIASVLKVSLKSMKIQRMNLTNLVPQQERSSPYCKLFESRS